MTIPIQLTPVSALDAVTDVLSVVGTPAVPAPRPTSHAAPRCSAATRAVVASRLAGGRRTLRALEWRSVGAGLLARLPRRLGLSIAQPAGASTAAPGAAPTSRALPAEAVPSRRGGDRALAAGALIACLAGIGGLTLPVVSAVNGMVSFAALDIPYVGASLLGTFVLISLLPVVDLLRVRLRWTAWLLLPGLAGAVPVLALVVALRWVVHGVHALWAAAPEHVVDVGAAPVVLGAADVALVVVGVVAIGRRIRLRRRRRALAR